MKEHKIQHFPRIPVILIPLLLVFSVLILGSIPGMFLKYPYEIASQWVCEDPEFSLSYMSAHQNGMIEKDVLIWNGEEIRVWIGFGKGDFTVYPKNSRHYDDRLLTGTWMIRSGKLILKIDEDFIFGGQYKSLVFSPLTNEKGRP